MSIHRPCRQPRCPNYAAPLSAWCETHKAARDKATPRAGHQLYRSAAWRSVRARKLKESPWCEAPDCHRFATEVDHIVPIRNGGAELELSNLRSLCKPHHSSKTAREVWGR